MRAPLPRLAEAGMTLLELMIVTVILGILAMIAMPVFTDITGEAYDARMQSDLKNLSIAEETYFVSHLEYTDDLSELDFQKSGGTQLEIRLSGGKGKGKGKGKGGGGDGKWGWTARATHPESESVCAVFGGKVTPYEPAEKDGVVACAPASEVGGGGGGGKPPGKGKP